MSLEGPWRVMEGPWGPLENPKGSQRIPRGSLGVPGGSLMQNPVVQIIAGTISSAPLVSKLICPWKSLKGPWRVPGAPLENPKGSQRVLRGSLGGAMRGA